MKKYIKNITVISLLFVLLVIVVASVRMVIFNHHSWKLPAEKHILFMGASHFNHGIDDTMMESAINWTRGSERYMYTYIKLQHLLPENPQIDTIFLELAPTDLWTDTDYKYHVLNEQSGYVKLYWPFYSMEQWQIFKSEPVQVLGLVMSSLLSTKEVTHNRWWSTMGGFKKKEEVMNPNEWSTMLEPANYTGHKVNYDYLRRIITLCKENNIQLYFVYCPMYHPEFFYDQEYYYKAYRESFSDIELFDYCHWDGMPLDGFADPHHLNPKGARIFTQELKNRFNIK